MTINNIDPAAPDANDPAGQGDDQIRALKNNISDTFTQAPVDTPSDAWDIPLAVGPRELAKIPNKAEQADLDSLDVRVGVNESAVSDHESRITVNEADIATLQGQVITLDEAWPIGSIFISGDGGTPTSKGLPGNWAAIGVGRFLIGGASGFGGTGGAMTVELNELNLPQHKHQVSMVREDSLNGGSPPATYFTSPNQAFNTHRAGRDASGDNWAIFNTDEGANLLADPDDVNIENANLVVAFYQRSS